MTAIGASSPCIPTWCSASRIIISRKSSTSTRTATATRSTPISTPTTGSKLVGRYKERVGEASGTPFPQDPHAQLWGAIGAVFGSWMNQRAITYRRLQRHPGKLGHRGQRPGHGVRQHGRDLGDRRRLHPQSLDRREEALRRISDQRPGRGRGRRHPHAAGDHRGGAGGSGLGQAVDGGGVSARLQGADAHPRRSGEALPRHAGPRIHGRAGQAVDAADAQRQAHRQGGAPHRRRIGAGEADRQGGGGAARRSGRARPAPASDHRSERRAQDHRHRPAGVARRGLRRDRVQLGRRGNAQEPGPQGHPGADRDLARGHPRHARRRRYSHHARRHDLARRGGRARHGQALRLRRRRAAGRLSRADRQRRRRDAQARRHRHHRRLDRAGAASARCRCASRNCPASSPR